MSRRWTILTPCCVIGVALMLLSCGGDPVQKGALVDQRGGYRAVDLSNLEVTLASPESFIVDEQSGCYFISNVNGAAGAKDDNGYIIKLDSSFNVIDNYFIDGRDDDIVLHAPKGMVIRDTVLHVCDLDALRSFSTGSGAPLGEIDFSQVGATFLNGITADNAGNLYVSETYQHKVYRVDNDGIVHVHAEISFPNGLRATSDGAVYVVTWETGRRLLLLETARIFRVDPNGRTEPMWFEIEFENLDGVDVDADGRLIFSDYGRGVVYAFDPKSGELAKVAEVSGTPAGISCDRSRGLILIPDLQGELVVLKQD